MTLESTMPRRYFAFASLAATITLLIGYRASLHDDRRPSRDGTPGNGTPATLAVAASSSQKLDQRLEDVEAQLRQLRQLREATPPALPKPDAPVADSKLEVAPQGQMDPSVTAEEFVASRLTSLESRLREGAPDPQATAQMNVELERQFAASDLKGVHWNNLACRATLCRLELAFNEMVGRDRDLQRAIDNIKGDSYVYLPDGESLEAEVYVARAGHELFPAGSNSAQ
jgi:hypothetical protein